jgi:hypothetical protein
MRKRPRLRTWVTTSALAVTFTGAQAASGSETPLSLSSELSSLSIAAASAADTDDHDEMILSETLHTKGELEPGQWVAMVDAAERRLLRQIEWRFSLADASPSVVEAAEREVQARRSELDLARVRRIIETQRTIHRSETDLTRALTSIRWEKPMRKFAGPGSFHAADLLPLSAEFEREFHRPMPVTARGETATHLRLGLDHRGKFDVGVNPETPEGIWLRRTLEARQIPYIAFRIAVRGAATAAHIHIGTASTRIPRRQRAAFRMAFYRERARAHTRLYASVHRYHRYHGSTRPKAIVMARSDFHATPRKHSPRIALALIAPVSP